MMKLCTKCNHMITIECFAKNRSKSDGRQGWCRTCTRQSRREKRAKAEKITAELELLLGTTSNRTAQQMSNYEHLMQMAHDQIKNSQEPRPVTIAPYPSMAPMPVQSVGSPPELLQLDMSHQAAIIAHILPMLDEAKRFVVDVLGKTEPVAVELLSKLIIAILTRKLAV